jgi:hypothetical protein
MCDEQDPDPYVTLGYYCMPPEAQRLKVRVWRGDIDTRTSAAVDARTTVRDAMALLHLSVPRAYLAHAHRPCFMQGVAGDTVLADAIRDFPLTDGNSDRSVGLLTLHVICA